MGVLDSIMGGSKGKDGDVPQMQFGADPYAQMAQPFDPSAMQLLNAPQGSANAQIAEFATSNDDIIEYIKEELRGYRIIRKYNMETKQEENTRQPFGVSVMNDEGINEVCRILRMFLSKPFLLSNFEKEDRYRIDMMMMILWKKLAAKFATCADKYELDRSKRSDLAFSIVSIVYMNVMRSYEDGERPRMYGSHKTINSIQQYGNTPNSGQEKKGWSLFG
jgi:hypothetical protein